ncbi:MAG: tetratricopeptide repeat protein, partial [Pseudomonadota bacterium]
MSGTTSGGPPAPADARRAAADLANTVQTLLRQGQLEQSERTLGEYLEGAPGEPQALYLLAVVHRYQRRYEDADAVLIRLIGERPDYARAYQEQGHLMRALGEHRRAIDAFARAVHLNPALLASWEALQGLLEAQGQRARAQHVARERAKHAHLPKPLLTVHELIADGRLLQAEQRCRDFLRRAPRHVPAMRLLARIALELGVLDDAEFLLESAVAFAPEDVDAHVDYITALRKRQRFEKAQEAAAALLARDPDDPRFQSIHAVGTMQLGDFDGALAGFERILQRLPGDPITLTSKGHALKTSGRYEEAVAAYRAAIDQRPTHGEAWYSLANLKTYRFDDAAVERMGALEGRVDLSHQDRIYLSFALGKAYEDRQSYEASFAHYARGNEAKRRTSRYDAAR